MSSQNDDSDERSKSDDRPTVQMDNDEKAVAAKWFTEPGPMSSHAMKQFYVFYQGLVKRIKFYQETKGEELHQHICRSFLLPPSEFSFVLVDKVGDEIVLSPTIPMDTRLTLRVVRERKRLDIVAVGDPNRVWDMLQGITRLLGEALKVQGMPTDIHTLIAEYSLPFWEMNQKIDLFCRHNLRWYEGEIKEFKGTKALCHFVGWGPQWDEWLEYNSERLGEVNTHGPLGGPQRVLGGGAGMPGVGVPGVPGQDGQQQQQPAPLVIPAWVCVCSLENPVGSVQCLACELPYLYYLVARAPIPWTCQLCTSENAAGSMFCGICEGQRVITRQQYTAAVAAGRITLPLPLQNTSAQAAAAAAGTQSPVQGATATTGQTQQTGTTAASGGQPASPAKTETKTENKNGSSSNGTGSSSNGSNGSGSGSKSKPAGKTESKAETKAESKTEVENKVVKQVNDTVATLEQRNNLLTAVLNGNAPLSALQLPTPGSPVPASSSNSSDAVQKQTQAQSQSPSQPPSVVSLSRATSDPASRNGRK